HQNLEQLIQTGAFRSDLYYRLNGATLKLPSLCQRADRQHVINSVLRKLIKQGQIQDVHIRADAMSAMLAYHWPGNIRELANALAFAEATCDNHEITADDLPEACLKQKSVSVPTEPNESPDRRRCLLVALETYRWNITEVARRFDVSRPTIYRWLQHHGIEQPRFLGKR
ncbi:MAG: helix-turn-helix domain-containing protein, partial [Marinobacter sp.]